MKAMPTIFSGAEVRLTSDDEAFIVISLSDKNSLDAYPPFALSINDSKEALKSLLKCLASLDLGDAKEILEEHFSE